MISSVHAVCKEIAPGVATEVAERQHRDRRPVGLGTDHRSRPIGGGGRLRESIVGCIGPVQLVGRETGACQILQMRLARVGEGEGGLALQLPPGILGKSRLRQPAPGPPAAQPKLTPSP